MTRKWIVPFVLALVVVAGIFLAVERPRRSSEGAGEAALQRQPVPPDPATPDAPRHYPVGRRPLAVANHRYPASFFPNTERLASDEMRVTALGTGMPYLSAAQKSSGWMVELGNGDIFLFDVGTGSQENLAALRPDWSKIDKVFVTHLHTDHVGDMDALLIGGWLAGRYTPLHVYGPAGDTPELGTAAFARNLRATFAWDIRGRAGRLPDAGGRLIAHEFDYATVQVVYERSGVKITQYPQIHALDGAVGFRLDWNGLSFVFGGDSIPSRWFLEQARGADIAIHECFYTPEGLAKLYGWPLREATNGSSYIHTPPSGFGKLMSAAKPRLAVAYHVWLTHEAHREQVEAIRRSYDGPLTMADDLVVWNITPEHIEVRKAVVDELPLPPRTTVGYAEAERSEMTDVSERIRRGAWEGYTPPPLPEP